MIQVATVKDIAAIMALMKSVEGFWQETWDEAVLAQGIQAAGGLAFVWNQDDEVIGFVCGHDLGFRGYVSELIVAEKAHGLGIGTQLLQHVEQMLARRGRTVVIADVWKEAESFYRSLGYTAPDAVLLRKELVTESVQPNVETTSPSPLSDSH